MVISLIQLPVNATLIPYTTLFRSDVTVSNPDGPSAVSPGGFTVGLSAPTISVAFLGKLRDKVGHVNSALTAAGALALSLHDALPIWSGARTVTRLELSQASAGGGV